MNMFAGLTGELERQREEDRFVAEWRALRPDQQSLCPWCRVNTVLFGCFCYGFNVGAATNITVKDVKTI